MNNDIKKEVSLEELFQELDQLIVKMESGNIPLDQAFALYEQGVTKVKECNEKLDLIEKKMLELNAN